MQSAVSKKRKNNPTAVTTKSMRQQMNAAHGRGDKANIPQEEGRPTTIGPASVSQNPTKVGHVLIQIFFAELTLW